MSEIDTRTDYEKMIDARNSAIVEQYERLTAAMPMASANRRINAIAKDNGVSGTLTASGVRKVLIAAGVYTPQQAKEG